MRRRITGYACLVEARRKAPPPFFVWQDKVAAAAVLLPMFVMLAAALHRPAQLQLPLSELAQLSVLPQSARQAEQSPKILPLVGVPEAATAPASALLAPVQRDKNMRTVMLRAPIDELSAQANELPASTIVLPPLTVLPSAPTLSDSASRRWPIVVQPSRPGRISQASIVFRDRILLGASSPHVATTAHLQPTPADVAGVIRASPTTLAFKAARPTVRDVPKLSAPPILPTLRRRPALPTFDQPLDATGPAQCIATPEFASEKSLASYATPLVQKSFALRLAAAARRQTQKFVIYNPAYFSISYPAGDVPALYGVCTDVIVRAYRALGIDLQVEVSRARGRRGDRNIDHRRAKTLNRLFKKHAIVLPNSDFSGDYQPGDIVVYHRPQNTGTRMHIAMVADQRGVSGNWMIVHNRGWGPQLEDALFVDEVIGHYRYEPRHARRMMASVPSTGNGGKTITGSVATTRVTLRRR